MTLGELEYRGEVFRDDMGDWIAVPTEIKPKGYWLALRHLSGVEARPDLAAKELMLAMRLALEVTA